jgi:hypothetical protein
MGFSKKVDGEWPRLAADPVCLAIEGSELSEVWSPFGSKQDQMGIAPAKGFESKARAELELLLKWASRVITMLWGCSGDLASLLAEFSVNRL